MSDYLGSLQFARFLIYSTTFEPMIIGEIHDGTVFPHDLEQKLLEPIARGCTLDIEILKPEHRWYSIAFGPGGGPARRVVRWPRGPRSQPGRPWLYGVPDERLRRIQTTVGDLVAATGDV